MADTVTSTTSTTSNGTTYTSSISNDSLTNDDFLQLMLTELKNQDPTEPSDTDSMIQNQLQMSTLDTNISMTESMEAMTTAFEQSNLSNSASLIGRIVENGNTDDTGNSAQYSVASVYSEDGEVFLKAYEITGYDSETSTYEVSSDMTTLPYTNVTTIY